MLLPLGFIGVQVFLWVRNVPNWDEFDTVLDFLIALQGGASPGEILGRLLAVTNEHRTLVSRVIFALGYALSGGINFAALAVVGNLFLLGTFLVLIVQVQDPAARRRLAAVFALVVFQLQHHESLFWAGASIDHFFVVLVALGALAALATRGPWSLPLGCIGAFLASFSLAHGLITWPIGMALLAGRRRWRECAGWSAAAVATVALYFTGFHFNAGHQLPGWTDWPRVISYWLALAGSSPGLDDLSRSRWWGVALVIGTALLLVRSRPHERMALAAIAWCLGAMAMIALGRALLSSEWAPITSRYVILSSVASALLTWLLIERAVARWRHPQWWLVPVFGLLVAFNLVANRIHLAAGRVYALNAETAVRSFHEHGTFADVEPGLYPDPERADALVRLAGEVGIFQLPDPTALQLVAVEPIELHDAEEVGDAAYFIEEIETGPNVLRIQGWAFRPNEPTRLGEHAVVFRSDTNLVAFAASPRLRPDVAEAFERPDTIYAGFEAAIPHEQLPAGVYGIGICFNFPYSPQYMMTASSAVIEIQPSATVVVAHQ